MSWKFWKKDELALPDMNSSFSKGDYGLGSTSFGSSSASSTGLDLSDHFQPGSSAQGMGTLPPPSSTPFGTQPSFPQGNSYNSPPPLITPPASSMAEPVEHNAVSKDLEVIAAKLDTIRAQLEMLNTRVGNLERGQQQPGTYPKRPWY